MFCDDLSFDAEDTTYKSLKAVLEGGIEGRPDNVIFYATSNRRHLMSRDMMENERSTAINPGETVEEKVSLSDRFGLWLGFHRCSQDEYLAMVEAMSRTTRFRRAAKRCSARRWNGRPRAARAPAASPGNTCRIWPGGSGVALQDSVQPSGWGTRSVSPDCQPLYAPPRYLRRIDRGRALADLEVQLRRGHVAGLPGMAIICPRLTWSPRLTRSSLAWA